MMADLLGVTFDKVEERTQHWFTPAEMPTCGGSIAAGTRGAIWFGLHGMVGGKDVIVLDHIYRAHPTAAPEWRQPPGSGGYALEIKGDPDWVVDFAFASREGSALHAGQFVTAVRAVNAIGAVCDAKPGLLTPMDLPLISGRDLFYAALPRT
jgi:hypothetical protein